MGAGSVFDDITVTGSGTGGVSLVNTTGTTTLGNGAGTDLDLTTTSGATAALNISNGGTVSVPGGGTANLSATGGPAADITGTSGATFDLDAVSSTNSATDGINIDGIGAGSFTATGGSVSGAAGISFDLNGGSGTITYPGTFNNGSGSTAIEVTGRSGGTVTLAGAVNDTNDAGGGLNMSGNTGGSTTLSNATKTFNTGASNGVVFNSSDGHTLNLTGGGLNIDTTSGKGLEASASGTINVVGTVNTIDTTSGTALNITNTDIGASGTTFEHISSNGAANGIVLNTTGTSGGLTVTGTGGTCVSVGTCTGGAIQASTASGVVLTSTRSVSFSRNLIQTSGEDGIEGSSVTGLNLAGSLITNNGDDSEDVGVGVDNLFGDSAWSDVSVTASELANVMVTNTSGTLNSLDITGASHFDSLGTAFGGNSILVEMNGTATMNTGLVDGATFVNNKPARGITVQAQGSSSIGNAGGNAFVVQNSTFTNNGLQASFEQSGTGNLTFKLLNNGTPAVPMTMPNTVVGTSHAVNVASSSTSAGGTIRGRISGNRIGDASVPGSGSANGNGIRTLIQGQTAATLLYDGNVIRQTPLARGIDIQVLGPLNASGSGPHDITVTNNDVNPQDSTGFPSAAIYVAADSQGGGAVTVRTDIRGNTVPAGAAFDALPTFLILDKAVAAAVCQLVDTAPASPNPTAQLTSTNTGSASAQAGCTLIAGPIGTPP